MSDIKSLTDYQHARLRTEMYLGSRSTNKSEVISLTDDNNFCIREEKWVPALFTAFREILDNSLDELIGFKAGQKITIDFDESSLVTKISDDGRGIPLDKVELALSHARAGRNFEERKQVGGTNGIGASVVNFCSEYFTVSVTRDGKKLHQEFTEGNAVDDALQIKKPVIKSSSGQTGTEITFKPSAHVFSKMLLPETFVRARVFEIAYANPDITFVYNKEKIKAPKNVFKTVFGSKPMEISIKNGFVSNFYIVPNFTEDGNDFVHSLVNNIPAFNGGDHIDAFRRAFVSMTIVALEKESKRRKLKPNRSDILHGLLIYNVMTMDAPNFDSQSKTRLVNEEIGQEIEKFIRETDVIAKMVAKNKEWVEQIFERCSQRTNKKDLSELERQSRKLLKKKVAKLKDATGRDRTKCILLVAEGDSAVDGFADVRSPKIHGGLPLRGKIMNARGEDPKRIMASEATADLMTALGLVMNKKAKRDELRYNRLFIAHDMDVDGFNIGSLVVNFLYEYWPELFDKGEDEEAFVNVLMTPFVILGKGKEKRYYYAHDYEDFKPNEWKGWSILRAKGLGTLQMDDWKNVIDNPVLFKIYDDGEIEKTLDLIFNKTRADDRKEWMSI